MLYYHIEYFVDKSTTTSNKILDMIVSIRCTLVGTTRLLYLGM